MAKRTKTLRTDYLARVEGEGAMLVKIRDGKPVDVKLRIYEPPRFFEALLRGRQFTEAPDITARICGICPVAYQTSSVNAMEDACGVLVGPADPRAPSAPLLRRVDREPRAARLHAPRARLPRLRERDRPGQGPPRTGRARAAHEEDRERDHAGRRRPRSASDQRQGRRLLPRADEEGARHPGRRPRARARVRARDRALHRRARLPRVRTGLRARRSFRARTRTRSRTGGWFPTAAWISRSPSTKSTSSRSTSNGRTRSIRA